MKPRFKKQSAIFILALSLFASSYPLSVFSTEKDSSVEVDNSKKNTRDVQGGPVTPEDQSESKNDLLLTQRIRQSIVKEDSLSTYAKNIKIITHGGLVTLRGPVESQSEKDVINTKAQQIAGAHKVKNQLEVKTNH